MAGLAQARTFAQNGHATRALKEQTRITRINTKKSINTPDFKR